MTSQTTQTALEGVVGVGRECQTGRCRDVVSHLSDREVISPQVFRERRVPQSFQAPVEIGDRKALSAQRHSASADHLQRPANSAFTKPSQHHVPFGQQGEVPHIMTARAQPADDLIEEVDIDDGHRRDQRCRATPQSEIEDFVDTLSPGRQILEIAAQLRRHRPVQPETDMFRVADDAARQATLELVGSLRLSSTERPVDPQQHTANLLDEATR